MIRIRGFPVKVNGIFDKDSSDRTFANPFILCNFQAFPLEPRLLDPFNPLFKLFTRILESWTPRILIIDQPVLRSPSSIALRRVDRR
ncbi:MAG: hypothetical protein V1930_09725, partial [Pseudomonadota bacterium]